MPYNTQQTDFEMREEEHVQLLTSAIVFILFLCFACFGQFIACTCNVFVYLHKLLRPLKKHSRWLLKKK